MCVCLCMCVYARVCLCMCVHVYYVCALCSAHIVRTKVKFVKTVTSILLDPLNMKPVTDNMSKY